MASLTHVCMWSDNDWKPITAEQATKLHPGGTVSAVSGLFMCSLCGQYVTLTDGDVRIRYFRHSAYEKSKDCPERTSGLSCSATYLPQEHDLPIRITNVSASSFSFEIGLIRAPIRSLDSNFRVVIQPKRASDICYVFNKERLNYNSITYLPIGEIPFEKYTLSFQNGNNKLHEFWPPEINGIDPEGTLFDKASGQKLPYDSDVLIDKEYYLLAHSYIYIRRYNGIQIKKIVQKRINWDNWTLYVVSASKYNEEAARFYLDFHCRLASHPVSLKQIWPLFVEGNYIIKHNQDTMYMLAEGNISAVKTFPNVPIYQINGSSRSPRLYEVRCSGRQQLISAGRTKVLQYTYFWKEPLDQTGSRPELSVTDLNGVAIDSGEAYTLPKKRILRVKSSFDGEIIVFNNNRVIDKRKLSADKCSELDRLSFGTSVKVVIGLDVVWQINFKKKQYTAADDETEILRRITEVSGSVIQAPHSLRNMSKGMDRYPKLLRWIRKRVRDGTINEQSYRRLQEFYLSMRTGDRS